MLTRRTQEYLDRLAARGVSLGLDRMRAACAALGHPERSFLPVTVAGTNGKGSVSRFLYGLALAHGVPAGLYTSPHLVRVNERISFCGADIADPELDALVDELRTFGDAGGFTYFEFLTLLAFVHFRKKGARLAVLEVGIGGRLDATNAADAAAAVITPIGLDHTAELGPDTASIAREKAGVIRPGIPVVSAAQDDAAGDAIREACAGAGAPLLLAGRDFSFKRRPVRGFHDPEVMDYRGPGLGLRSVEVGLLGPHQAANAALALSVFLPVCRSIGIDPEEARMRQALKETIWPARFQIVGHDPDMIIDGAHNPHGARALAATLAERTGGRPVHLVFGAMGDKDFATMAQVFARALADVVVVRPESARAADPAAVARVFKECGVPAEVEPDAMAAISRAALRAKKTGDPVLVSGSLYLAGEVLARLERPTASPSRI